MDAPALLAAKVKGIRGDINGVSAHLKALDTHMAEADERTSGFEAALLEAMGILRDTLNRRNETLEARVAALEQWRRDQAS